MPIGLNALSDEERKVLEDRLVLRLQQEMEEINAIERGEKAWHDVGKGSLARRSGKYLPLSNVTVRYLPLINSLEYRIYGACALAHREMRWSPWMLDDLANVTATCVRGEDHSYEAVNRTYGYGLAAWLSRLHPRAR